MVAVVLVYKNLNSIIDVQIVKRGGFLVALIVYRP